MLPGPGTVTRRCQGQKIILVFGNTRTARAIPTLPVPGEERVFKRNAGSELFGWNEERTYPVLVDLIAGRSLHHVARIAVRLPELPVHLSLALERIEHGRTLRR